MNAIEKIKELLQSIDQKDFYYYLAGFFAIIVCGMGLILYQHHTTIQTVRKKIATINNYRKTTQDILSRFERVKEQKANLVQILEKEKNFKIVGYFDEVANKLGLTPSITSRSSFTQELENLPEYREIRLVINFTAINMRQLTELLQEIERKERIYTKELDITKAPNRPTLDVLLTIATLQPRTESAIEGTE